MEYTCVAMDEDAQDAQPLTEYLYRLSLEDPRHLGMFIGHPLQEGAPNPNLGTLAAFITGFREATGHLDVAFFTWLREQGVFPGEGWARHLLRASGGDHQAAIQGLFALLHRFLLETRPAWFLRFNRSPQPSQLVSSGASSDLRLPEHVRAAAGP